MCCKFEIDRNSTKIALDYIGLPYPIIPDFPAVSVSPSESAFILSETGNSILINAAMFGFLAKDKQLLINARQESVITKPSFSDSFLDRRCLIPVKRFFEWDEDKIRFSFSAEQNFLLLAGIYKQFEDGRRFSILTTDANESMAPIHDRMPVIVSAENACDFMADRDLAVKIMRDKMPLLKVERDSEQLSFL